MKLTIQQKGNHYCYLDSEYKTNNWSYCCVEVGGGWLGLKSAFSPDKAEIRNQKGEIVASITFQLRFFKPHILKIELMEGQDKNEINVKFLAKLSYYPFTFEAKEKIYRFEAYRGHLRALYENDIQAALFNKEMISFFGADTFVSYAEDHLSIQLIFALSIFDDIWTRDKSTMTLDFGDLAGKRAPKVQQWRPK